jgi:hypothetical protein
VRSKRKVRRQAAQLADGGRESRQRDDSADTDALQQRLG